MSVEIYQTSRGSVWSDTNKSARIKRDIGDPEEVANLPNFTPMRFYWGLPKGTEMAYVRTTDEKPYIIQWVEAMR